MGHVLAVPASPVLVKAIENFYSSAHGGEKAAAENYIAVVDHMTELMLGLLFSEPADKAGIAGGQRKVIEIAANTAGKASHMLTRQVFKKVSAADLRPVADRMHGLLWRAEAANGNQDCLASDVEDGFAADFQRMQELVAAGEGSANMALVAEVMNSLSDQVTMTFFEANTRLVKVGAVARKILDVGIDGSRAAGHAVTNKVTCKLEGEALQAFVGHYRDLIVPR